MKPAKILSIFLILIAFPQLSFAQDITKDTTLANSFFEKAGIFQDSSEYDSAIVYFENASLLYEKHRQWRKYLLSETKHGQCYQKTWQLDQAIAVIKPAIEKTLQHINETASIIADTYHLLGLQYYYQSKYDSTLFYWGKVLKIKKELLGEKHTSVAACYNNIGAVYENKNEYGLALEYHFKSLQIKKELLGEKHTDVANSYNNIGGVYTFKNEYDLALEYHFKSLQIKKELLGEKHTLVASSYNNIGGVYKFKNEYGLALEYYFKSLQIKKKLLGEKHILVARDYNNIGIVYSDKIEYDLALEYYQKGATSCLRYFNDTANVYSVPQITDYLDWQELLQALQAKAQILATNNKDLTGFENLLGLNLALRHYQACDTLINQVRKTISTKSDKIALGEKAGEIYEGAIDVCLKLAETLDVSQTSNAYLEQAFYFSEKNKSSVLMESLAGSEAKKYAGIPDNLLQVEHTLQIDIALYQKLLAEVPDSAKEVLFRDKLFKANRSYDSLIAVFENQYPEYYELKHNRKPVTVSDIQETMDEKTAMISYFVGDSSIYIFSVKNNNLEIKTIPVIENPADSVMQFRNSLRFCNSSRFNEIYKRQAFELYTALFPQNLNENIENLIIIPDRELSMVPFEALLTAETGEKEWSALPYLIRKYNISYSYSANLFYKTFQKEVVQKANMNDWLAIAPVFSDESTSALTLRTRELFDRFDKYSEDTTLRGSLIKGGFVYPLPGSENEVTSIFNQFEKKRKKALAQIHMNANEEFIKSGEIKNYRILHFATHGFVNTEKPELSGILLAQDTSINEDGVLYTGEIFNLKLNADLTVLSACETGLGQIKKGEGLIGLTRALLYAGSENIIVSLWKVADESTSDLMVDFYKNLLKSKQKEQEFSIHLRQAKLSMIEEGKYAHPFYWAPFVLIGK